MGPERVRTPTTILFYSILFYLHIFPGVLVLDFDVSVVLFCPSSSFMTTGILYDTELKSCNIAVKNKFSYAYTQEFPYRTNHILECEFYLLENLDCCLIVYQPYRPLLQLIQDIGQEDQLLALAWRVVNDSLRTDVCLLYPPYQIALGE